MRSDHLYCAENISNVWKRYCVGGKIDICAEGLEVVRSKQYYVWSIRRNVKRMCEKYCRDDDCRLTCMCCGKINFCTN